MTWLRAWDHLETLYMGEDLKLWEKVSEKSAVI